MIHYITAEVQVQASDNVYMTQQDIKLLYHWLATPPHLQ